MLTILVVFIPKGPLAHGTHTHTHAHRISGCRQFGELNDSGRCIFFEGEVETIC